MIIMANAKASGGIAPVANVPWTSTTQMTGAEIQAMFRATKPTSQPVVSKPIPRPTTQVTQRQEPPKPSTLTPAKRAQAAQAQANIDKAVAESQAGLEKDFEVANLKRVEQGKAPLSVPQPLPEQVAVMPDRTIHGIPERSADNMQLMTAPTPPPLEPRTDVLSDGSPAPTFPWTPSTQPVPPPSTPLPWRSLPAPPVVEVPAPSTPIAVSQEEFVPGVPTTVKQISPAEAEPFLRPVAASKSAARPMEKIQGESSLSLPGGVNTAGAQPMPWRTIG